MTLKRLGGRGGGAYLFSTYPKGPEKKQVMKQKKTHFHFYLLPE